MKQEPVAWTTKLQLEWLNNLKNNSAIMWNSNDRNKMGLNEESVLIPLYTTPRELSDEEIKAIANNLTCTPDKNWNVLFAKAILKKVSEK